MALTLAVPAFDIPQLRARPVGASDRERAVAAGMPLGKLLSYELLQTIPQAAIEQQRTKLGYKPGDLPPLTNGVKLFAVKYVTTDLKGHKVVASGLTMVPDVQVAAAPLLAYQHGTFPGAHNGPSENLKSADRTLNVVAWAGTGHVCSLADYLGFGASAEKHPEAFADPKLAHVPRVNRLRVFHPYLHTRTEASAGRDMLRATRQLCDKENIELSRQLFISGYSQGGQAAMALHRELESTPELRKEFPVTASAPMAGAHDIVGTLEKILVDSAPRSAAEVAYGFLAYDNRVGLRDKVDEIFSDKYARQVWKNFSDAPGTHWTEGILGVNAHQILNPCFVGTLYTRDKKRLDRNAHVNKVIATDHTDKWNAQAPVRLVHGAIDKEVSYEVDGAPVVASMRKSGAKDIDLITVPGDHVTAVLPAFAGAAQWLATHRSA